MALGIELSRRTVQAVRRRKCWNHPSGRPPRRTSPAAPCPRARTLCHRFFTEPALSTS